MSEKRKPMPGKWTDPEKGFVVHRDMQETLMNYTPGRKNFKRCFEERDAAVDNGETYWNTNHDEEMRQTARERSQRPGWKFPTRKKKK